MGEQIHAGGQKPVWKAVFCALQVVSDTAPDARPASGVSVDGDDSRRVIAAEKRVLSAYR
jgi:hypothetical protein